MTVLLPVVSDVCLRLSTGLEGRRQLLRMIAASDLLVSQMVNELESNDNSLTRRIMTVSMRHIVIVVVVVVLTNGLSGEVLLPKQVLLFAPSVLFLY